MPPLLINDSEPYAFDRVVDFGLFVCVNSFYAVFAGRIEGRGRYEPRGRLLKGLCGNGGHLRLHMVLHQSVFYTFAHTYLSNAVFYLLYVCIYLHVKLTDGATW